jgi:hypothetical protein
LDLDLTPKMKSLNAENKTINSYKTNNIFKAFEEENISEVKHKWKQILKGKLTKLNHIKMQNFCIQK